MEVKVVCPLCETKYKFDVVPENDVMPAPVSCPECGEDGTPQANEFIASQKAPLPAATPAAPPPNLRVTKVAAPHVHIPATPAHVSTGDEPPSEDVRCCKYHPKIIARWMCLKCIHYYCDVCVSTRSAGQTTLHTCRQCASECVALNVSLPTEGPNKENFFIALPKAFLHPLQGNGLTFLICGTLFFGFIDALRAAPFFPIIFSVILLVVYGGYIIAYVEKVVQVAAQGSDEPATWPDISEMWSDIVMPFLQVFFLMVVCFGPALVTAGIGGWRFLGSGQIDLPMAITAGALLIMGALYFPMAFLVLALTDTLASVHPFVVIPAMFKAPLEYCTVLLVTAMIMMTKALQMVLLAVINIPILPEFIAAGFGLYFLTVQGRMLGLLYFAKRDELGWFAR